MENEIRATKISSRAKLMGIKYTSMNLEKKQAQDMKLWEEWLRQYHRRLLQEWQPSQLEQRLTGMKKSNPTFILRNWIAFKVTEAAENNDYQKIETVYEMLQDPYNPKYSIFSSNKHQIEEKYREFIRPSPDWAPSFTCTCSS